MPDYVNGCDISHHQGIFNFDTALVKGKKYCIIRAGSIDRITLTPYTDYQFERNSVEGPRRFPCGFYWYFRPTRSILQADYFCNLIKDKSWLIRPVIDVETAVLWSSSGDINLSMKEMADQVELFVKRVFVLTGVWPILYTRMSFWTPYVEKRTLWSDLDLWTARYSNTLTSPWSDGEYLPRDWVLDGWKFWH